MLTRSTAADRLLLAASGLFAAEGIRAVGIDRILAEAGVAKATLYQAFGSKEALVVAYLEQRDARDRQVYRAEVASRPEGPEWIYASFDLIERAAQKQNYIGCVYANALNEFPDPGNPVAGAVHAHRAWLREQWVTALGGRSAAAELADRIQLVYDGALLGIKASRSTAPVAVGRAAVREWLEPSGD